MSDDRKLLCRGCHNRTRHERAGSVLFPIATQFVGLLGAFWCCLPILLPLWGLLFVVSLLVPLQCVVCCRWTWRRGAKTDDWITDIEEPEGELHYDTIRLTRHAFVARETDLVPAVNALVRAVEREGAAFKLYARDAVRHLRPARTALRNRVRAFVLDSKIEWNFGREPGDPTHRLGFFSIHQAAVGGVNLRIKFVLEGTEATRPGLEVTLELARELPTQDRDSLLARLQSRFVAIVRPDVVSIEVAG